MLADFCELASLVCPVYAHISLYRVCLVCSLRSLSDTLSTDGQINCVSVFVLMILDVDDVLATVVFARVPLHMTEV